MDDRRVAAAVQELIDAHLGGLPRAVGLEAGCGSWSLFRVPDTVHLVGLDISEDQLSRNHRVQEKMVADLQSVQLEPAYDLIVCIDVIEHLERPDLALDNLLAGLAPGGLLVVKAPNPASFKGWITRSTPLRWHVLAYRHLFGVTHAGTEDRGPFPTPMHREMWIDRILARAALRGVEVVRVLTWDVGDGSWFARMPNVRRTYRVARAVASRIAPATRGDSEFVVVLRRSE